MNTPTVVLIKPRSGKLLWNKSQIDKIDPYLVVKYNSEIEISKVSKMTDKYPFWMDSFDFPFNTCLKNVQVECWNYLNNGEGESFLGFGEIKLNPDDRFGSMMQWVSLKNGENDAGEIFFEMEFKNQFELEKKEVITVQKERKPILYKQISYQPNYGVPREFEKENERRIKKAYTYTHKPEALPLNHYYLNNQI